MRPVLTVLAFTLLFAPEIAGQEHATSTKAGVYTTQQASRGRDVYLGNCKSCHVPESHTGATFNATWNGRALSELYVYIRDLMPKNDPGSLSPQENADVVAYLLRMNRMPAGKNELPVDSTVLKAIRFETTKISVRKDQ
jgi:mono/diheme cytochrome c family protein